MNKLFIMQGIPGSGKSTIARKLQEESPTTRVIVSRDAIRHARGVYWVPEQEKYISQVEYSEIVFALEFGYDVIIDATNLNEKTLQKWKAIAAKYEADIEYVKVDTPLEECLRRNKNADREHVIPDDVIKDFYKRFKQLQ